MSLQLNVPLFASCAKKKDVCLKRERKPTRYNNQMFIINFCLNMFRASLCPSSGEQRPQRPTTATNHIQQNQRSTPYAVTHGLCSPEDGHNDARNMLRQKLIINIWLLHLVGFFLSLPTLFTMHGHKNLKMYVYSWSCILMSKTDLFVI